MDISAHIAALKLLLEDHADLGLNEKERQTLLDAVKLSESAKPRDEAATIAELRAEIARLQVERDQLYSQAQEARRDQIRAQDAVLVRDATLDELRDLVVAARLHSILSAAGEPGRRMLHLFQFRRPSKDE